MKNIAIVTGASSGIGREFVLLLDKYGLDEIWGVALEQELLARVGEELTTPLKQFICDLTIDGCEEIKTQLQSDEYNIKYLINCAGFGKFGRYDEIELAECVSMIELNNIALVKLTNFCLPYILGNGKILQVSSLSAFQPTPYIAVYSATKAFVYNYSRALNVELRGRNIGVCAVCPYWTDTNFFSRANKTNTINNYVVMYDPKDVAQKALKDANKGKDISVYGFVSKAQKMFVKILPHKFVMWLWCKQKRL